ncbi:MAG: PaaI family thioesterase [Bacilli bacterium]|nr:PaaI family thioesterase [Bacilli bacterium]
MDNKIFDFINKTYFMQDNLPIFEDFIEPKLIKVEEGFAEVSVEVKESHLNLHRITHGGVLSTLADITMGTACIAYGKSIVTAEMSMSFIRGANAGQVITAKAKVDNNGNNLMRTSCNIYDDNGKLLLSAIGSFFVLGELEF